MAAAHCWEGQCICCTTNSHVQKILLNQGLYCLLGWHQLICSSSTPAACRAGQPPVDRSLCHHDYRTCIPQPADACFVVWDTIAACTPIHRGGGRPTCRLIHHSCMHAHPQRWWSATHCTALADSCCCCFLYMRHSKTAHGARALRGFSAKITPSWPFAGYKEATC